jgi:hypothetical protein
LDEVGHWLLASGCGCCLEESNGKWMDGLLAHGFWLLDGLGCILVGMESWKGWKMDDDFLFISNSKTPNH